MSYPKGKARVSNTRCRPPNHEPQKFGGGLGYCRENATDTNVPDCVGCTRDSDIVEQSAREVVREVRHCGFAFATKVVYMKRRGKAKKSITHSSSAQYNYYRQQRSFQLPAHILYHHIHSLHSTIFDFPLYQPPPPPPNSKCSSPQSSLPPLLSPLAWSLLAQSRSSSQPTLTPTTRARSTLQTSGWYVPLLLPQLLHFQQLTRCG